MITSESEKANGLRTNNTLMVCIDAFSQTYLSKENTPFMFEMASKGIHGIIEPLFAFRGIETTMFSGVWPEVHGTWTEICLRQDTTFGNATIGSSMVHLLDLISSDKVRKLGRVIIQRLLDQSSVRLTPNLIPAEAFGFFEPSQKKAIFESGSTESIPTVFDLLRQGSSNFAFIEPPILSGDSGVVHKLAKLANSKENRKLWYIKFGKPDKDGHAYGPRPEHFRTTLREVDYYLRQVVSILERKYGDLNIMILADHGMSNVNDYHDILNDLKTLKAKMYKDYIVFLDSTMARFWFLNEKAKTEVEGFLSSLEYGHTLSRIEMEKLHVPDQKRYGELIFVVDEGKMIYPDFWSGTRKAKGMHGYAFPSSDEAFPILIANKEMSHYCNDGTMTYVDVFKTLKNSLSV